MSGLGYIDFSLNPTDVGVRLPCVCMLHHLNFVPNLYGYVIGRPTIPEKHAFAGFMHV